ncbi:MAG: PEP-CTERM sorting domain-containing protein [Acidobacteria bacterium]|nr:PEP-CTERM sorting domain-containing protein [Acidobacteriota bacterium]
MKRLVVFGLWLWSVSASCFASSVEFTVGSSNVQFSLVGNSTLQVTLSSNLMTATSPNDVLTGVYFTTSQPGLSAVSASVNSVQNLLNCPTCTNASIDIGAEWAFQSAVSGILPATNVNLLGAADFGTLGLNDRFGSNNLYGSTGVGGIDFGIVGGLSSGQSGLTGSPLISRQAIFVFNAPNGFNLNGIGSVGFLYGYTSFGGYYGMLDDSAPEPQTWLLAGIGLVAIGWIRRKQHP